MTYNNKPDATKPKRRSLFGTLYNPEFGKSARPIGESARVFVNLIALIFAMHNLIPKNHPALAENAKNTLSLSDVISIAWDHLSFTKEGLPKVVLFFAVVGGLICGLLTMITILAMVVLGQAHAQTFTAPNTKNDIGWNLIDYLFSPTNAAGAYTNLNAQYSMWAGGVLPNTGIMSAFWKALGFYSNALLIFAGIILGYHLVSMVLNTAHDGVVMGKRANQVWAPLRLAAAVILLVPVSSQLNCGQLIVMQVAQWGSGLASQVWDIFKTQLMIDTKNVAVPPTPEMTDLVIAVTKMAACEYDNNFYQYTNYQSGLPYDPNQFVSGWTNSYSPGVAWNFTSIPEVPTDPALVESTLTGTKYHFRPITAPEGVDDICGSYTIPNMPTDADSHKQILKQAVWHAHVDAFNDMLPAMLNYATNIKQYFVAGDPSLAGDIGLLTPDTISMIAYNYQQDLNARVTAAVADSAALTDKYLGIGWIGAGAFFNQIVNVQSAVNTAVQTYGPTATAPQGSASKNLTQFSDSIQTSIIKQPMSALPPIKLPGGGPCPPSAASNWQGAVNVFSKLTDVNLFGVFLNIINTFAQDMGVWCGTGQLGLSFTGTNPLAQMAQWGRNNINMAINLFNSGGWFMIAGGLAAGSDIGDATALAIGAGSGAAAAGASVLASVFDAVGWKSASKKFDTMSKNLAGGPMIAFLVAGIFRGGAVYIGQFLMAPAVLFVTLGVTFGFVIPLLPFMHFTFGTVTWLALLFEAVIAMPLVALAHITPEGEGLPGAQAKGAYFMAFSIFLRPVCMVFGLIAGYMAISLATSIVNMFILGAISGGTDDEVINRILYTVVYVSIILSVANHAFKLINIVPEKVMSWMGAQGAHGSEMGNPQHIETGMAGATAWLGAKTGGAINSMGSQFKGARVGALQNRQAAAQQQQQQAYQAAMLSDSGLNSQRLGAIANNTGTTATNTGATAANTGRGAAASEVSAAANVATAASTGATAANTGAANAHLSDITGNTGRGADASEATATNTGATATSTAQTATNTGDILKNMRPPSPPAGAGGGGGSNPSGPSGSGGHGKPKGWDGSFEDV